MTAEHNDLNKTMNRNIDRLVIGELPEERRRELFHWCNDDPIRWRQCALAFLEAQAWQQGMSVWTASVTPVAESAASLKSFPTSSKKSARHWAMLAGIATIAFFIGLVVRDPRFESTRSHKRSAIVEQAHINDSPAIQDSLDAHDNPKPQLNFVNVPVRTSLSPGGLATLQIPVATSQTPVPEPRKPELPDYVRKQWEKHGFQVAAAERFLNANLPDGRDVVVPISGLEVKYVGKQVY